MRRTRVKICGITRAEDVRSAVDNGADAIGLVFYNNSPRNIDVGQAQRLSDIASPFVTTVALFKDADVGVIEQVLNKVLIDLLQFHGSESPEFCRQFQRPYIKSLGMLGELDIENKAKSYEDARGILLDGHAPGADGGTGESFDWRSIPSELQRNLILAGGLNAENVYQAIRTAQPYAVDVSSGVEQNKGVKSAELIQRFMNEVNRADVDQ